MLLLRGVVFSKCKRYRYLLSINWESGSGNEAVIIMLNPSTATEMENDPTIERCEKRMRAKGYSGLKVLNLFAYRATEPKNMLSSEDPIGSENMEVISKTLRFAAQAGERNIYCGWGNHGTHLGQGDAVKEMIRDFGLVPVAIKRTKSGQPVHPLYQSYENDFSPILT